MVFRSQEHQETVDYVKEVKSGRALVRQPGHMKSSEASVKSWLKSGTNMPDEMDAVQSQRYWDAELDLDSSESKGLGSLPIPDLRDLEDVFATTVVVGFGLGLVALVNPALVPVIIGFVGKVAVGVGVGGATIGYSIDAVKHKLRERKEKSQ